LRRIAAAVNGMWSAPKRARVFSLKSEYLTKEISSLECSHGTAGSGDDRQGNGAGAGLIPCTGFSFVA
jgi:hypothetical protein